MNYILNCCQLDKFKKIDENRSVRNGINLEHLIDAFDTNFNELFPPPINKKYERIQKIIDMKENYNLYIKNKNYRIISLGKISTGKTSLINSIDI